MLISHINANIPLYSTAILHVLSASHLEVPAGSSLGPTSLVRLLGHASLGTAAVVACVRHKNQGRIMVYHGISHK